VATLKAYAEDIRQASIHDVKLRCDFPKCQVDPLWLQNIGYEHINPKGKQHLNYWCKSWLFPKTKIHHSVYHTGASVMIITPGEPTPLKKYDMSLASDVLSSAFRNSNSWNPKLVSIERSRVDDGPLLAYFNENNIKELKIYRKDSASLRVEITYLHPALSPFTESLLFGWCGQTSNELIGGIDLK
jgi:hypothetical protein